MFLSIAVYNVFSTLRHNRYPQRLFHLSSQNWSDLMVQNWWHRHLCSVRGRMSPIWINSHGYFLKLWFDPTVFFPYYRIEARLLPPPTVVCMFFRYILHPNYNSCVKDNMAHLFEQWSDKIHHCRQTVEDLQCKEFFFIEGTWSYSSCTIRWIIILCISQTDNWPRYLSSHSNTLCYYFMASHLF
jgi:hypothetical protein